MKESIFFQKYACLCPGTLSVEASIKNPTVSPGSNISIHFAMNKAFKNVVGIQITLFMDLKVHSLLNPEEIVTHITKELGRSEITKEDLVRNSDGQDLFYSFELAKIQEQNDYIWQKFLRNEP